MSFTSRCWLLVFVLLSSAGLLRLLSHGEPVPLTKPLTLIPANLGNWTGEDLPIEQKIIDAIAVDDYLNRIYKEQEQAPLLLYIGYYKSQRTGQTIHSPKNCLPGSGWQPVRAGRLQLRTLEGNTVEVNSYLIEKGLDKQLVLYWYQSHGRIIASEYWGKIFVVLDALRLNRTDSALVRMNTPVVPDEPQAMARLTSFAQLVIANTKDLSPR